MSTKSSLESMLSSDTLHLAPELIKRMYCRPDYRRLLNHSSEILLRRLSNDPEALKAVKQLLGRYGIAIEGSERIIPLIALGICFAGGVALGYAASSK
jgi:hypothetical protein